MIGRYIAGMLSALLFLTGCAANISPGKDNTTTEEEQDITGSQDKQEEGSEEPVQVRVQTEEAEGNFALSMLRCLEQDGKSLIYSPYSIADCVTLCYDGLSDDAKNALTLQGIDEAAVESYEEFDAKHKDSSNIRVANKVYLNKDLKKLYDTSLIRADSFEEVAMNGQAAGKMNSFIEKTTNGKIKKLIPASAIKKETSMVLINALYLKKDWKREYDPYTIIWKSNNKKYKGFSGAVPAFCVKDTDGITIVRLPYKEDDETALAMYIITEDEEEDVSPAAYINNLKDLSVLDLSDYENPNDIDYYIHVPEYETRFSESVLSAIRQSGLSDVLTPEAYSKIGPMEVGEILHGAYIKTDINGTEAAAATAMMMDVTACMPEVRTERHIVLDKPFYYFIRDDNTGIILFAGKTDTDTLTPES